MNEAEWLGCRDPQAMLELRVVRNPRKLRLFACACCRDIWHLLDDDRYRNAVEVTERFADGWASRADLGDAMIAAMTAPRIRQGGALASAEAAAWGVTQGIAWDAAAVVAREAAAAAAWDHDPETSDTAWYAVLNAVEARQADLLRDVFGNPFRPVSLDPAWLVWNDRLIPRLAEGIYEERAFDRLPVLGDALEEAGCDEPRILDHCRGPGPHILGCWLLDLVLGK